MNHLTRVLLVLLRLAIGWHFLFEGIEKVQSIELGPTETSKPFTSASYLREATGPLGNFFRQQVGDPDQMALDRLAVQPETPANKDKPYLRLPEALNRDWDDYFNRFVAYYQLDDKEKGLAQVKLDQAKGETVAWLLTGSKEVTKTYPSGEVKIKETTLEQILDYRRKLDQIQDMERHVLPLFGRDVEKQVLTQAKTEAAALRTDLMAEVDKDTADMKGRLQEILTADQKAAGPVPEPDPNARLNLMDQVTSWGLVAIGAGLLIGLFTRLWCLLGAGFLLTLYLSWPPFPWLPAPPVTEGHYLFVNKELIEMLALLTLATTRSGRWLGLDGLLPLCNPKRWRRRPPEKVRQVTV